MTVLVRFRLCTHTQWYTHHRNQIINKSVMMIARSHGEDIRSCSATKVYYKLKIGTVDQTPRETLEERLEGTPSNARCFAQGSSSMC
jgi:hypothetical protein